MFLSYPHDNTGFTQGLCFCNSSVVVYRGDDTSITERQIEKGHYPRPPCHNCGPPRPPRPPCNNCNNNNYYPPQTCNACYTPPPPCINCFQYDVEEFYYESIGLYGSSQLRKVYLRTGQVVDRYILPPNSFAEGITCLNGEIYQLTWKEGIIRVFNANNLAQGPVRILQWPPINKIGLINEAWGICNDGTNLYISNGSNVIFKTDNNANILNTIYVSSIVRGMKAFVSNLNELEFVKGYIYANVWKTNKIAVINPDTGVVLKFLTVDMEYYGKDSDNVANGILYSSKRDKLIVTGKRWNRMYEIDC